MNQPMSKLMMPQTGDVISRQRLSHLTGSIPVKNITIVTAGPGYGKTALMAHTIMHKKLQNIWYRLGSSDNDPTIFFSCLIAGVQKYYPEFRDLGLENEFKDAFEISDLESFFVRFLSELDKNLTNDLFIVLDDYHVILKNREISLFLQLILDRASHFLHLALISRAVPLLKFSRLMADRQVIWITQKDLAFTSGEIKDLYIQLFDLTLEKRTIDVLREKTGGWVAGLILFYTSLREKSEPDIESMVEHFKGSHRNIFNYLEENVFQMLSNEIKDFLLRTAILSSLHVKFCNQFLKIQNARAILCDLEDSHSFVFSKDEDRVCFVYHPLFKQFLQAMLELEFSSDKTSKLYNDAAMLYEKEDEGLEALKHHILAGNIEDASRLLNHLARPIIKQGRPQMVKSLLSGIPEHYLDEDPWFQYLQAGYMGLCNQLQLAVKNYEKVLKAFRRKKDEEGECICRMELAEYYMSTGDLKRSEAEYRKILNINKLDAYLTIIVMGYLIRVLTLSRNTSEADKYAKQAIALLSELNDEVSLNMGRGWIYMSQGFRYAFSGNYHKTMELGENSKSLFESAGQFRFMFSSYFLISSSCFYLGLFSKGMASALEGVEIDREKGVFDEFSEFLHLLHARNCLEMEDITSKQVSIAVEGCKKSLKSFQTNAFPGGVATAFLVLHKAYLQMDDISGAELSLRKGIKTLENHDMPLVKNELKVALSQLLFFKQGKERNQEAMVLLKQAEQELLYSGWHMCWISRIYARYYLENGSWETTFKYIVYSLKISEEQGFDAWIISEKQWIIPLLVELFAINAMSDYIKKLFIAINVHAEKQLIQMQNHKRLAIRKAVARIFAFMPQKNLPLVSVKFFGQFRLFIGKKEIPESIWKSKKARSLFKYLLCMRHKGYLDKEILMELLWPNEDPKKSAQRFHVALAALRKVLEPGIPKGVKSSYISRSGASYRIDIPQNGLIDIEEFQTAFDTAKTTKQSEKALSFYKKAEYIYQGDFLEEDLYEDWCAEEREKFQQSYLFILEKIIEYHEIKKDYSTCIAFANKYLNIDKYSETIIRSLMRYYALNGNNPMVIRIYEKFKTSIRRELDCGLSDETKNLFTQLITA